MGASARVLFVCLGNICRSPMAEAVLRHLAAKEGLADTIEVDSAGTGDWHLGRPPHEGTQGVLAQHGISWKGMKARQVEPRDYLQFQYVVCMDTRNLSDVRERFGIGGIHGHAVDEGGPRVFAFMELLPERGVADVPDPYYSGNFEYVYELVEEGCRVLLEKIKADLAAS